ncbi:unnamed protein product [Camellia sinensis]
MALMGGFARIGNNEITVLVNDAEKSSDIDPQEAQQTLEIVEANLKKAEENLIGHEILPRVHGKLLWGDYGRLTIEVHGCQAMEPFQLLPLELLKSLL